MKKKDLIKFVEFGLMYDVDTNYILEDILKILKGNEQGLYSDVDKLIESYKR